MQVPKTLSLSPSAPGTYLPPRLPHACQASSCAVLCPPHHGQPCAPLTLTSPVPPSPPQAFRELPLGRKQSSWASDNFVNVR